MAIYTVVGGALNVRASKSTSSTKLGQLASGTSVDIVRCDNTWSTLQYNGTPAFVMHQYLSGFSDTKGKGLLVNDTAKTNASGLNVRTGPGLNNPTTGSQLSKGTSVTIYGIDVNSSEGYFWYRINSTSTNPARLVRGDFLAPGGSGGSGGSTYTSGRFGATNTGAVFARTAPIISSSTAYSTTEKLRAGSTFLIQGTESGAVVNGNSTWVKVRYGTSAQNSTVAYIHSAFFDELPSTPSTAKDRCIKIAMSLDQVHETVIGLSGNCCQQFIYWLCGASGKTVNNMPYSESYCGPARDYFNNRNEYRQWNSNWAASNRPYSGNLVYYGTPGASTSPHVGLIVDVNTSAKTYTSIECNLSDRIKQCSGSYLTGYCSDNGYNVQGFAAPSWS